MCWRGKARTPAAVTHTVPAPSTVTSGRGLRIGVLEIGSQGYITAFQSALPTEKVAVDKNSGVICTPV